MCYVLESNLSGRLHDITCSPTIVGLFVDASFGLL